jgi:hypothetical protein
MARISVLSEAEDAQELRGWGEFSSELPVGQLPIVSSVFVPARIAVTYERIVSSARG